MAPKDGRPGARGAAAAQRPAAAEGFDPLAIDKDHPKVRQILEAASRLFMELPYDAVSTDAVAREAKVSKATLYVYFPSKETLFATLIGTECTEIADRVWDASAALDDVEGELRQFAENFVGLLESPDTMRLYRSVVAQSVRFPELGRLFYEAGPKRFEGRLAEFLAEAGRRGLLAVPDPRLAALQFIQLMAGDLLTRGLLGLTPNPSPSSAARVDRGIALFMAGYRS